MNFKGLLQSAVAVLAMAMAVSCTGEEEGGFVSVRDGKFIKDGKPYYFVGANMWYAGMLASDGVGGDRERLAAELDSLQAIGVDNIRVLVGSDGPDGMPMKVEPSLQKTPGAYNDTILAGLDYLMAELGRRDMTAVLYLTNSWEWSGGYGMYLEWAGFGKTPLPKDVSWDEYCRILAQFYRSDKARQMYLDHVRNIVTRRNAVTGKLYSEDRAIFSWQLCNEPRPFSADNKEVFLEWADETSSLIKSLDSNHMVSTGSEGLFGCEVDSLLFDKLHNLPCIDYFNIHIWPYNWRWINASNLDSTEIAISESRKYIDTHIASVEKAGKPLVIEEFGYPRDGFLFDKSVPVSARDRYYSFICSLVAENAESGGVIAGCNFWAWGGMASQSPVNLYWKPGDDYCGDPAQEQQGLYSVYASDVSTIKVIKDANARIDSALAR